MSNYEHPQLPDDVRVVVAGAGAPGLTAALTLASAGISVIVVETAPVIGGTTALGGGRTWIPLSGDPANIGDTTEAVRTYLGNVFDERYPEMIDAFIATTPEMRRFVEAHSAHRWVACPNYPDYHPHAPGGTSGGRCFDVEPIALSGLVPEARATLLPNGYLPITHDDWERWRYPRNFDWALVEQRKRDGIRTGGAAMTAGIADGAVRAGARILTDTALTGIDYTPDGVVEGVRVTRDGREQRILTGAILLTTGGYDSDPELFRTLLPAGLSLSASSPANRGTALRLAEARGARLDNLGQGWWMPMISIPGEEILGSPYPRALIRERGVPHQIIVNAAGERFCDEALPYNEFGKAVHGQAPDGGLPNKPCWMIFDAMFRRNYALPGLPGEGDVPAFIATAATLRELAEKIGVDANGLEATVERWNVMCVRGTDEDFHRGENAYDRYYGDPWLEGNRNLGPVGEAPYFAVEVLSASIGSKGGPVTDVDGRVLQEDGDVVPGLYAAGNAAAFWTGDGYPGPGATLSVGMTFAYRAANALVAANEIQRQQ